jgi:hypothetical protein
MKYNNDPKGGTRPLDRIGSSFKILYKIVKKKHNDE